LAGTRYRIRLFRSEWHQRIFTPLLAVEQQLRPADPEFSGQVRSGASLPQPDEDASPRSTVQPMFKRKKKSEAKADLDARNPNIEGRRRGPHGSMRGGFCGDLNRERSDSLLATTGAGSGRQGVGDVGFLAGTAEDELKIHEYVLHQLCFGESFALFQEPVDFGGVVIEEIVQRDL